MKSTLRGAEKPAERRDGAGAGAGATPARTDAPRTLTVTVAMPDHRLTMNRVRSNHAFRARLVAEHKDAAWRAAQATIPFDRRPFFPAGVAVVAWCAVERRKRGQRWDLGGLVEALKPAFDGLKGLAWADDAQLVGVIVEWDVKPTGAGVVHLTLAESPR